MEIKPYSRNAKKHPDNQLKAIAKSIKEFGWQQPIVVDKDNEIIVGHGRWFAYEKYGKEMDLPKPEIKKASNLTKQQVKAYRLADNKLNESDWDMDLAIEELKELDDYHFELTGFDKDLLIEPDEKDDEIPDDAPAVAKLGDIWQLGRHRLMCGDSTKREDVEKLMDGKKADMVFTDPPWNVAIGLDSNPRHRQREGLKNDNLGKDFYSFLEKIAINIVDFNKGDVYCVMGCEEWPNIHKALTTVGLHWSSTIVWSKDIFVLGRSKYHRQYEPIWYGWKDKSKYRGDRKQSDLWQIKRPKRSEEHPTMKPVELCSKGITNSSVQDDIILDLFLGSGSTLIACEKTNRICYGMELDEHYCDVIIKRYEQYTNNKAKRLN